MIPLFLFSHIFWVPYQWQWKHQHNFIDNTCCWQSSCLEVCTIIVHTSKQLDCQQHVLSVKYDFSHQSVKTVKILLRDWWESINTVLTDWWEKSFGTFFAPWGPFCGSQSQKRAPDDGLVLLLQVIPKICGLWVDPKYRAVPKTSGLPEISGNTRCSGLPATWWFLKLNGVGSGIERNTG